MAEGVSRRTVAVLGGGIAGLSAAFSLSRQLDPQRYKIVVLEAQKRLGGWMHSERVPVHADAKSDATALLESGPRSLMPSRYKGLRTLEMVCPISDAARPALPDRQNGVGPQELSIGKEPVSIPQRTPEPAPFFAFLCTFRNDAPAPGACDAPWPVP